MDGHGNVGAGRAICRRSRASVAANNSDGEIERGLVEGPEPRSIGGTPNPVGRISGIGSRGNLGQIRIAVSIAIAAGTRVESLCLLDVIGHTVAIGVYGI